MPKIPRAASTQELTTKAPSTKVDIASYAGTGDAIARVGAAVQEVNQKFTDLRNLEEYTRASTTAKKDLSDLENQASQDDDIYTISERYAENIQKVKDNAVDMISDQETKMRFKAEMDLYAQTKQFNINAIARDKQVSQAKGTLLNDMEQAKTDYFNASSPLERAQLMDSTIERINEYTRLGVIDPEMQAKTVKAFKDEVRIGQVHYDMSIDPDLAKANVDAGVYDLNPKEKEEALNDIAAFIKKKQTREEVDLFKSYNVNEQNTAKLLLEPGSNMKETDIDRLELLGKIGAPGGISPGFAEVARRTLKSSQTENPTFDIMAYSDLLDQFKSLGIKDDDSTKASLEDLIKFRSQVMRTYSDGKIAKSDATAFLEKVANSYADKIDSPNSNMGLLGVALGPIYWIYAWAQGNNKEAKEARARVARESFQRINAGEDPRKAVDASIDNEKVRTNENYQRYKDFAVGSIIDTPNGQYKLLGFDTDGEPLVERP